MLHADTPTAPPERVELDLGSPSELLPTLKTCSQAWLARKAARNLKPTTLQAYAYCLGHCLALSNDQLTLSEYQRPHLLRLRTDQQILITTVDRLPEPVDPPPSPVHHFGLHHAIPHQFTQQRHQRPRRPAILPERIPDLPVVPRRAVGEQGHDLSERDGALELAGGHVLALRSASMTFASSLLRR